MDCQGCVKAIRNALSKVDGISFYLHSNITKKGVTNVDINLEKQLVIVNGTATSETLLQALQKTGKAVTPFNSCC